MALDEKEKKIVDKYKKSLKKIYPKNQYKFGYIALIVLSVLLPFTCIGILFLPITIAIAIKYKRIYKLYEYIVSKGIKETKISEKSEPGEEVNPVEKTQIVEEFVSKVEQEQNTQKDETDKGKSIFDVRHEAELKRLENCKYDVVVIDFETTGLKSPFDGEKYDEILSVSIIDQDENVLLNTLCKPKRRKTWAKAQEIHGISPSMVKNQPTFEEVFPTVKEILYKAKVVIAYNIPFEMKFLWGFDLELGKPGGTQLIQNVVWGPDPMLMYSAYKGNEKWQKLSAVARHFKFEFSAHNSLEDVKATLHCYKKLLEYVEDNPDKDYIIKYGFLYDDGKKGEWIDYNTYTIRDGAKFDYFDPFEHNGN